MSNEGLMLSCIVDTMEFQYVGTSDIPGAFKKNDYNKQDIHINMEGVMVTLLKYIDPARNK